MRVLITGITGFVGRRLARALVRDGSEVVGLARAFSPDAAAGSSQDLEGSEVVLADLLDRDAVHDLLVRVRPEAVVHLAGLSHVGESWGRPGDYLRVNFTGTLRLLAQVRATLGESCRLIFASSSEVYGNVPEAEQPIAEERALGPRSPYAMTKACAEEVALDHQALVVRSFNAIGPGQGRNFALPSFAHQLAAIARGEAEPVLRVGDLSPRRDFLHVDDAVAGYRCLLHAGDTGRVYNLASGRASSIQEMVERLLRVSGVAASVQREQARVRPVDIPLMIGDSSRLRALGWQPSADGVERALTELWQRARQTASEEDAR